MTRNDFELLIRKKYRLKKLYEYFLSILAIGFAIFFFYEVTFTDWLENKSVDSSGNATITRTGVYVLCGLFIVLGLGAFATTRKNYVVHSIDWRRNERFLDVSETIADKLKWQVVKNDSDPIEFMTKGFWTSGYSILVTQDFNQVHFDIQHFSLGVFDFGVRKRLIKKFKTEMKCPA